MNKICVFAGTTEGRRLAQLLAANGMDVTACVATEYGQTLLSPSECLRVRAGRMEPEEMERMMRQERFDLVVDATHPYARVVTENVLAACQAAEVEYLRLLREESTVPDGAVTVPDSAAAAAFLDATEGTILLTTGSKELAQYASGIRDFGRRAYVRVLPMEASLQACQAAGVPAGHIIAMQGPFSEELNAAMLRSVSARYLVTKESGDVGGFAAKAAAAQQTGAVLVVVGRPPSREGMSLSAVLEEIQRRFGMQLYPRISIVGLGPGAEACMTGEARAAIARADCVVGARRMLAAAAPGQEVLEAATPQAMAEAIQAHPEYGSIAVVMSGDTGFYSGTRKLVQYLPEHPVEILPGISSLSYLCARLSCSYEDVACVSLHGRTRPIAEEVRANCRIFVLVGGSTGVKDLCRVLTESGLGAVKVYVGERLSYPDEQIRTGEARELAEQDFAPLSAVLIENPAADRAVGIGLPDSKFCRGSKPEGMVPMTKSEVRAVCLSKLQLTERSVCWDVGAGTGSVSVEMALQARRGQVYAVERVQEAAALVEENRRRFSLDNLTVVSGCAPEACRELPTPDRVFLGGTSGRFREIIALALEKNPAVRIVAAAVSLESVAELTACMEAFPELEWETVCLFVARTREAGHYHLFSGQNPVYLFTMQARSGTE